MLANMIQDVLSKVLGKYVEKIRDEDMEMNLMGGSIKFKNLVLKPGFLKDLDFPIDLRAGKIRSINAKIILSKIGSEPVEVSIDGIYVFLKQRELSAYNPFKEPTLVEKKKAILDYIQNSMQRIADKVKEDLAGKTDAGFMQKMGMKILDNLQIFLKNVHFQVESIDYQGKPFSFGIGINELQMYTTNDKWEQSFLDRTVPENSTAPLRKCAKSQIFLYFLTSTEGYQPYSIDEDPKPPDIPKEGYVLSPMNCVAYLTYNNFATDSTPKLGIEIVLDNLKLQISKVHYNMYLILGEHASDFMKETEMNNSKRRFALYRPIFGIKSSEVQKKIVSLEGMKNENAICWWKYAIKCIISINRERKSQEKQFVISSHLDKYYQRKFLEIFLKEQMKKPTTVYEQNQFEKIILIYSMKRISQWIDEGLYQIEKNIQQKKETKPTGLLGGFLSWGAKEVKKAPSIVDDLTQIFEVIKQDIDKGKLEEVKKISSTEFAGKFVIRKAKLKLLEKLNEKSSQSIELRCHGLGLNIIKCTEQIDFEAKMGYVELVGITKPEHNMIRLIQMAEKGEESLNFSLSIAKKENLKQIKIQAQMKPMVFFYQQMLLLRLLNFLGKEVSANLTLKTGRSLSSIGQESLDSLRYSLEKHSLDINIAIASPILLLPVLKNNDPCSPLWVMKLGNLFANSVDSHKRIYSDEYFTLNAKLSSINLQYYNSYTDYVKREELKAFSLIKDLEFNLEISLLMVSKCVDKPKMCVTNSCKEINFYVNETVYSMLLNIHKTLALEDNIIQMLKTEKSSIIKFSKKMDSVHVLHNGKASRYYVILSGAYLYFYQGNKQEYPSFYFYLPNCNIVLQKNSPEEIGIIALKNEYGSLELKMSSEKQQQEWHTLLLEHIASISDFNTMPKVFRNGSTNLETILLKGNFDLAQVNFHLLDEENKKWIIGNLSDLSMKIIKRPEDSEINMKFSGFSITNPDNPLCPTIITASKNENAMELLVEIQKMFSPKYKNKSVSISAQVGHFSILYAPPLIKRFVKYISKNTIDPDINNNILSEIMKEEPRELLKDSIFLKTCKDNREIDVFIDVKFSGAKLICLHHEYFTPFIKLEMLNSTFGYHKLLDHDYLFGQFGDITLYDMTNHPQTIAPQNLRLNNMKFEEIEKKFTFLKLISLKASELIPTFEMFLFQHSCPLRPTTIQNTDSLLKINMEQVWALYVDELSLKRVFEYVIDKFIYSLTPKDDIVVEFPEIRKNIVKFSLPENFTQVECQINSLVAEMRPRPNYGNFFCITARQILFSNSRKQNMERYINRIDRAKLFSDIMVLEGKGLQLKYNDEILLTPFDLQVKILTPCVTPEEYNNHDNKKVNLEMQIEVSIPKFLNLALNPEQTNLLFQCIHLNLTYTDGLSEQFHFVRQKPKRAENWIKISLHFTSPGVALELLDCENIWLLEAAVRDINVENYLYWNSKTVTTITSKKLEMFDRDVKNSKSIMLFPRNKLHESQDDLKIIFESNTIDKNGVFISHSNWNILVADQIFVFRLNTLYMVLHILGASMPNYERLKDKPNKYFDQPSSMNFNLVLQKSTLFMQGEDRTRGLALEGSFRIKYSQNGFEDLTEAGLLHPIFLTEEPCKTISINLTDMSAYLCFWKHCNFEAENFSECEKRLIIEPVPQIDYLDKSRGNVTKNKKFDIIQERNLLISDIILTLTYLDATYFVELLQYHLEHMSLDYFQKQANYYSAFIPTPQFRSFHILKKISQMTIFEVMDTAMKTWEFFIEETDKLEQMRQAMLRKFKENLPVEVPKEEIIPKRYILSPVASKISIFHIRVEKEIKLLLINYFSGVFCPLFFVKLGGPLFQTIVRQPPNDKQSFETTMEIHYYHGGASTMEPFIEPFQIDYTNLIDKGKRNFSLSLYNQVNVNISDTFIRLLKDSWKLWTTPPEKPIYKKERNIPLSSGISESLYETICEFSVDNRTGEPLLLLFEDMPRMKPVEIGPREIINLCPNPSDVIAVYSTYGSRTFYIKIQFAPEKELPPLSHINLCRVNHFTLQTRNRNKEFFYDCKVKIVNMRKVFIISTCNQICNCLDYPIIFKFNDDKKKIKEEFEINGRGETMGVPFSLYSVPCSLHINDLDQSNICTFTLSSLFSEILENKTMQISVGEKIYSVLSLQNNPKHQIKRIMIFPPFYVVNYLPVLLNIKFISPAYELFLRPGKGTYIQNQSVSRECQFIIKIDQFLPYKLSFKYIPTKTLYTLHLEDEFNIQTTIQMQVLVDDLAKYQLVFFSKSVILNNTNENFLYYNILDESHCSPLAGQNIGPSKATLIHDETNFFVCFDIKARSEAIHINEDTLQRDFSIPRKNGLSDFVMKVDKVQHIPKHDFIKTRQYSIFPKFIFQNKTNYSLYIYQIGMERYASRKCPANEIVHFTWGDIKGIRKVGIKLEDTKASAPFEIEDIGTIVQELASVDGKSPSKILTIDRTINQGVYSIEISEETLNQPHYLLQNESKFVSVGYKDKYGTQDWRYLNTLSQVQIGWTDPSQSHVIILQFIWGNLSEKPIKITNEEYPFFFEVIQQHEPIKLKLSPRQGKLLYISVESDGYSKILKIKDTSYKSSRNCQESETTLSISRIGISTIATINHERMEIFYASMQGILFNVLEKKDKKTGHISIKNFQLDNQLSNEEAFPVTVYPERDSPEKHFAFVNFEMVPSSDSKASFNNFTFVALSLAPLVVLIQEDSLDYFTSTIFNEIATIGGTENPSSQDEGMTFNIAHLAITPIKLKLSYKHCLKNKKSGNLVIKSLAAAFIQVKEIPVEFEEVVLMDIYAKLKALGFILMNEYTSQLQAQKFSVATKVLLSPFRDMKHIGKGITNFFKKPTEGPLGLAKGTGGLVKGAFSSAFGTTSNLTSTLAKGLLALSIDKEYIQEKEQDDINSKPSNALTGIGLGLFSAGKSLFSGVLGVVTKPIEGASKGGVKGFFKGAGKGLVGVVTKPLSGSLDLVSKTAEGIKNTASYFDAKPEKKKRQRSPRVFYTSQKLIRNFDSSHSDLVPFVRSLFENRYSLDNFIDLSVILKHNELEGIVWISEEHVTYLRHNKVIFEVSTRAIQLIEVMTQMVKIYVFQNQELSECNLELNSQKEAEDVYTKLNRAIKH